MDFQRDYILRLIHMLGEFFRAVARLLDDQDRLRLMNATCHEHCGMPLSTMEGLTADSLEALLPPVPRLMAGELLAGKAQFLPVTEEEALALRLKAFRLIASLHTEARMCDLLAPKLIELKGFTLASLTADDLLAGARFFAQAERFDEMEDALFQALPPAADEAARAALRAEGAAMLRRAAHAGERTLALCGMTGAELRLSAREMEGEPIPHERENT